MDNNSTIGQLFEQGKAVADDGILDVVTTTKKQILGDKNSAQNQNIVKNAGDNASSNGEVISTSDTKEIVSDFYAPSNDSKFKTTASIDDPEELQRVRQELQNEKTLFQQLHKDTYYDPLFAYENKKPEKTKADAIEEEKQEKMQEITQKQAKKSEDIALQRAQTTTEVNRGVSG